MCHDINWISFWFPRLSWSTVVCIITNFSLSVTVCIRSLIFSSSFVESAPLSRRRSIISSVFTYGDHERWTPSTKGIISRIQIHDLERRFPRRHLQTTPQLTCDMKGLCVTYWRDSLKKNTTFISFWTTDVPSIDATVNHEISEYCQSWKHISSQTACRVQQIQSSKKQKTEQKNWTKTDDWYAESWQCQAFRSRFYGALSVKWISISNRTEYVNDTNTWKGILPSKFSVTFRSPEDYNEPPVNGSVSVCQNLNRKSISTNLVAPVFLIDPMTKRLRGRGSTAAALTSTTRKTHLSSRKEKIITLLHVPRHMS